MGNPIDNITLVKIYQSNLVSIQQSKS